MNNSGNDLKQSVCVSLALVLSLVLGACSKSDDNKKKEVGSSQEALVAFESIPSQFNPHVENVVLGLKDVRELSVNLFAFSKDVRLEYSKSLGTDEGRLSIYSVSKDSQTSVRGVTLEKKLDGGLSVSRDGAYECVLATSNRQIVSLKGACYLTVVLTLPAGSEVEFYNYGKLISKRFNPMSKEQLIDLIYRERLSGSGLSAIDKYLGSFAETGKTLKLECRDLQDILEKFYSDDDRLVALTKLHRFVMDRARLGSVIDSSFGYVAREKARKIIQP